MPVIYKRPRSLAAIGAFRIGLLSALLLICVWGLHRFGSIATPIAINFWLITSFIALFSLGLAIIGFSMLWYNGAKGGKASFFGFWLSLFVLLPIGFSAYRYVSLPQQFDVKTSQDEELSWLKAPELPVSSLDNQSSGNILLKIGNNRIYGQLTERRYQGAIDRVYKSIVDTSKSENFVQVASQGDDFLSAVDEVDGGSDDDQSADIPIPAPLPDRQTVISGDENLQFEGTTIKLQFTKSSLILGLDHHLLIEMREDEDATYVNMRSATGFGPHDLGLNAELINGFLGKVDANLQGIVGAR